MSAALELLNHLVSPATAGIDSSPEYRVRFVCINGSSAALQHGRLQCTDCLAPSPGIARQPV